MIKSHDSSVNKFNIIAEVNIVRKSSVKDWISTITNSMLKESFLLHRNVNFLSQSIKLYILVK